jgi:hypothetical protein
MLLIRPGALLLPLPELMAPARRLPNPLPDRLPLSTRRTRSMH